MLVPAMEAVTPSHRTRHRLALPRGQTLPESVWRRRHRFMMGLAAAHTMLLPAFGVYMGATYWHALLEGAIIAGLLCLALLARSRTLKATFAAFALVSSSAILVHFSGGYIEAHFHFFVALAFITLYQEWLPFAATVAFTVIHHGAIGALEPTAVYNHPAALANPWAWALIHGLFVFAAAAAYVVQWRLNEDARDEADVVLEAAGEAIVGVDGSHLITFANPAAQRLFQRRHLAGRPIESLLGSSQGLAASGRHTEETLVLGQDRPVEVVSAPIQGGAGHVLTIVDIQERRRQEQERLRHRDEQLRRMRELDELKNAFINTVAHELRTPMTPLRLQAGMLRRLNSGPETQKTVDMLDRNLERLHRLVDDVLDVTRLQAGRLTLRKEDVDLKAAIETAVASHQEAATASGTRVATYCPEGLFVHADPTRLGQMFSNLVANAVGCAPGGHVTVSVEADDGMAMIYVRDDGVGLAQDQLGRLFQPFGQVEGSPGQKEGTGLGLYLTRELALLHEGTVAARSAGPGRGSVFTLTLPLVMAQMVDAQMVTR